MLSSSSLKSTSDPLDSLYDLFKLINDNRSFLAFKAALEGVDTPLLQKPAPGKMLLNLALANICQPLLINQQITYEIARLKLTAFDLLLCRGALFDPQDSYTMLIREAFNQKSMRFYENLEKEPINIEPLASLKPFAQQYLTIFYWLRESFEIYKRNQQLEAELAKLPKNQQEIYQPIIICDCHDDNGSIEYLRGMQDILVPGYLLLIEESYNLDPKTTVALRSNFYNMNQQGINNCQIIDFATQNSFTHLTRFIDPTTDLLPMQIIPMLKLSSFANEKMYSAVSSELRHIGMYLETLKAVRQGFKTCAIVGALHGESIVQRLRKEAGITAIVVLPFIDPTKIGLIQEDDGTFKAKEIMTFLKVLINEFAANVLDMAHDKELVLQNFCEKYQLTKSQRSQFIAKHKP